MIRSGIEFPVKTRELPKPPPLPTDTPTAKIFPVESVTAKHRRSRAEKKHQLLFLCTSLAMLATLLCTAGALIAIKADKTTTTTDSVPVPHRSWPQKIINHLASSGFDTNDFEGTQRWAHKAHKKFKSLRSKTQNEYVFNDAKQQLQEQLQEQCQKHIGQQVSWQMPVIEVSKGIVWIQSYFPQNMNPHALQPMMSYENMFADTFVEINFVLSEGESWYDDPSDNWLHTVFTGEQAWRKSSLCSQYSHVNGLFVGRDISQQRAKAVKRLVNVTGKVRSISLNANGRIAVELTNVRVP